MGRLRTRKYSIDTERENLLEQHIAYQRSFQGELQNQIRYLQKQLHISRQQNTFFREEIIAMRQLNIDLIRKNDIFEQQSLNLSRRLTGMELQNMKHQSLSKIITAMNQENQNLKERLSISTQENIYLREFLSNLIAKDQKNKIVIEKLQHQVAILQKKNNPWPSSGLFGQSSLANRQQNTLAGLYQVKNCSSKQSVQKPIFIGEKPTITFSRKPNTELKNDILKGNNVRSNISEYSSNQ